MCASVIQHDGIQVNIYNIYNTPSSDMARIYHHITIRGVIIDLLPTGKRFMVAIYLR